MVEIAKYMLEIGTLYHSLLFSYQRGLRQHLGSRAGMYVHPAIEQLLGMEEQGGLKLDKDKTFEQAMSTFTDFLIKGGIVRNCHLEKIDDDNYIFRIEGCIWAGKVHTRQVSLEDVTCPYAVVAMALYKKYKGQAANERESEYFYNGTETILEPASP